MPPARHTLGLVLLSACAALGATGCGSTESTDEPSAEQAAINDAARKTVAGGTAVFTLEFTGALEAEQRLEADFRTDRAEGTITFGEDAPRPFTGLRGEVYIDGAATYARFPWVGPSWVALDAGVGGSIENQPTVLFESLETALKDMEISSSPPSGDAEGTPYEGTYDLRALVEQAPAEEREAAEAKLDQLGDATDIPATVAIGVDGLIRQLTLTYEAEGQRLIAIFNVSGVGKPVQIGPPPKHPVPVQAGAGTSAPLK